MKTYRYDIKNKTTLCLCGNIATTETKHTGVALCPVCADKETIMQLKLDAFNVIHFNVEHKIRKWQLPTDEIIPMLMDCECNAFGKIDEIASTPYISNFYEYEERK